MCQALLLYKYPTRLYHSRNWNPSGKKAIYKKTVIMSTAKMHAESHVWLFVTPWTVARQAPLSMEFPRPEYWSGCYFWLYFSKELHASLNSISSEFWEFISIILPLYFLRLICAFICQYNLTTVAWKVFDLRDQFYITIQQTHTHTYIMCIHK